MRKLWDADFVKQGIAPHTHILQYMQLCERLQQTFNQGYIWTVFAMISLLLFKYYLPLHDTLYGQDS